MTEQSERKPAGRSAGDRIDRWVVGFLRRGLPFLVLGWLPGVAAWQFLHGRSLSVVKPSTSLAQLDRYEILGWGAASLGLLAILYAIACWWGQRQDSTVTHSHRIERLNRRFLLLAALPFLVGLFGQDFEQKHDFTNLLLIAVSSGVFCVWSYWRLSAEQAQRTLPSRDPWTWPTPSAGAWMAVLAMFVLYGVSLSYLSIVDHHAFKTANFDLGIYDNTVWNTAHGNLLGCSVCRAGKHYSAHFDPILAMLVPFYRFFPRAETLLVFQAFWLGLSGIPLFLYARRRLENPRWALTIVAAFYCMPALHGVNLYDFHSLALAVPTAIFAVYFLDSDRPLGYALSIGVLLLTREDMSLICASIGLYAWFTGHRRAAVITVAISVVWLVSIKGVLMGGVKLGLETDVAQKSSSFAYYYKELIPFKEEGPTGIIISLLTEPVRALLVVFKEAKLVYFLKLLMPLLFLPLFSGKKRILMLYGFAFIAFASRKYVYSTHFQYSSLLIPFLALSVADAVVSLRDAWWVKAYDLNAARLQKSILLGIVFTSALLGSQYGVIGPNNSFRTGFEKLQWRLSESDVARHSELRDMIARIPPDAAVTADRRSVPHLSNRETIKEYPRWRGADYILLYDRAGRHRREARYKRLLKEQNYVVDYESKLFVLLKHAEGDDDKRDSDKRDSDKQDSETDEVPARDEASKDE